MSDFDMKRPDELVPGDLVLLHDHCVDFDLVIFVESPDHVNERVIVHLYYDGRLSRFPLYVGEFAKCLNWRSRIATN